MRKIDAVLLSALIIYDYSAQSLVDSDAYSLGQALASETSTLQENSPANSLFSENLLEGEDNTVRSVKHISALPASATSENTISYHELAKINSIELNNAEATGQNDIVQAEPTLPEENAIDNIETITAAEVTVENENVAETSAGAKNETVVNDAKIATYAIETVSVAKETTVTDPALLDTDADGVYDYEDKCQDIAGVARFEGCPVPDSDADGVNDEEDRCPSEAGTIENGGCPAGAQEEVQPTIEEVATVLNDANNQKKDLKRFNNQVSLSFNGTVLTNEDFNIVLQFADILIRQQQVKIEVSAARDNTHINYLVAYLKELGVNNRQVVVSGVENSTDMEQNKVYMQLKF